MSKNRNPIVAGAAVAISAAVTVVVGKNFPLEELAKAESPIDRARILVDRRRLADKPLSVYVRGLQVAQADRVWTQTGGGGEKSGGG